MDECTCGCACQPADASRGILADDRGSVSRRGVLAGSVAVVATMALGACADPEDTGSSGGTTPAQTPSGSSTAPAESPSESGGGPTGEQLATTTEFPVGGGKVVTTSAGVVVVTQPADGQFVAFNGRCPHQGCPVTEVTENTIVCQCHGSTFDGSTGDRLEGPAPVGLEPVAITVEGDAILLA
jgi:Rieske Fe-S protein